MWITGPGRNVDDIFPVKPIYLQGYTDHRGIVVERTPADAVRGIANMVQARSGTDLAAVSAKFGGTESSRRTIYYRRIEKYVSYNF